MSKTDYKHQYEQVKYMLTKYQDEVVPGFREETEKLKKQLAESEVARSDLGKRLAVEISKCANINEGSVILEKKLVDVLEENAALRCERDSLKANVYNLGLSLNTYNAYLPVDLAREFSRAYHSGRLWVSPVALGDVVWGFDVLGEPHPFRVDRIDPVNGWFCNLFRGEEDHVWMFEDVGKKVFLKKEEAEIAKEASR